MNLNASIMQQFFNVTDIGVAFYVVDQPMAWNDAADKDKVLDYVFTNERLVYANEAYLALSGANAADILDKTPADFFAFYTDAGKKAWRELLDAGAQPIFAYEIRPGAWIAGKNQCMYDEDGLFIGHISTIYDMSDNFNSQNTSHDLVLKKIPVYQYSVLPDGSEAFLYISDEFKDIFGVETETAKNDAGFLTNLIYFADQRLMKDALKTSQDQLSILETEFRINHPEKGLRWIKNTAMPEKGEDGRILWNGYFSDITESKKADEWIGFLNTALMNISDAVIITDKFGDIIYTNRRVKEVHGYEPEEMHGKRADMFAEPLPEKAQEELMKTLGEGKTFSAVSLSRRKDGSSFLCEFELTPVFDEKTAAYGLVSIQRDITDRINMMEELKNINERFEQLTKQSRAIAWEFNERGEFTYISNASYDVLGYHPAEMVGRMFFYELLADETESELYAAFSSKQSFFDTKCIVKTKQGDLITLSINGFPITNELGNYTGYRGLSLDITEKVIMEQTIKNEEERYRTTLLSVGDGVISTDALGRITVMNPVAEKLTGFRQEEAMGKPLFAVFNIIDEETGKPCDNPVHVVLKSGESYKSPGTPLLVSKSGTQTPIENNASPIKNNDGRITGAVIVFRDFSEYRDRQKKIEYLSFHDPLTGLYNRRFAEDAISAADKRENLPITIMVVDVNGLKLTNDAFGHKMGDNLLVTVSEILQKACSPADMIARMGGDEFIILMTKTDEAKAELVKQKLVQSAAAVKLESVIVSLAIGYAVKKNVGEQIEGVIMNADNHMYKEKLKFGKTMRSQTIETVLRNINYKYDREQVHTERVSQYCEAIAKALGLHEKEVQEIKIAGALHDIGKIIIPPEILSKPGKLTKDEYDVVKRHPETGYQILKSSDEYLNLAEYVLYHHERWDGKGYP